MDSFIEIIKDPVFQGLAALASILFYFYDKIIGFIKYERMTPAERETLNRERIYLNCLINELQEPHNPAQEEEEDYFYIDLKAKIEKIKYIPKPIPEKYRGNNPNKHDHKPEELSRVGISLIDRIKSVKGSSTRNLVKTLQKMVLKKSKDSVVVILGDPGSGKSASLRHLAIRIAKQESKWYKHAPIIPIYIPLGSYTRTQNESNTPQEIIEFVKRELDYEVSNPERKSFKTPIGEKIEYYRQHGRVLLLFDAMDEMPRADYDKRYKKLKEFTQKWRQNKFVFSCRKLDYDKDFRVREIIIKEFELSQIRHYLKKSLPTKQLAENALKEIRKKNPDVFELSSNPFFLWLITNSIKKDKKIPENQSQLFESFVSGFLAKEQAKWSSAEGAWIGDEKLLDAICRIAFNITKGQGMGTVATEQYILEYFDEDVRFTNLKQYLDVILRIGKRSKLLVINEFEKTIQFQHHRFQEYFTAQYLKNYQAVIESQYFDDIWWQEVIKMYAGISANANSVIENILNETENMIAEVKYDIWYDYDIRRRILDRIILASFCAKVSNEPIRNDLKERIINRLVDFKDGGSTLEKVKSMRGLANFSDEQTTNTLIDFLKEESPWIRKTVFVEIRKRRRKIKHIAVLYIKRIWYSLLADFKGIIPSIVFYTALFVLVLFIKFLFKDILKLPHIGETIAEIIFGLLALFIFVYSANLAVKYIQIYFEKRRLKRLTSLPEQKASVQKLFRLIHGYGSTTLTNKVIATLMTTNIPEKELIDMLAALSRTTEDQDHLWKSVEELEKRQIRKQFQNVDGSAFAEKALIDGKTKVFQGRFEEALKFFDKAVEFKSNDQNVYYLKGTAKMEIEDFPGAITEFTKVIELEPDHPWPYAARADAKIKSGLFSEAIDDCNKSLMIEPNFIDAIVMRIIVNHNLENFDEVFHDCNRALKLDPMNFIASAIRGDIRRNRGDLKGAIADFDKVIQIDSKNVEALLKRAEGYLYLGNFKKAISDSTNVIEIDHNNIAAYGIRGDAKRRNGDYNGAIQDYTRVLELDPSIATAYLYRGIAYISARREYEGCKDLIKARDLKVPGASEIIDRYRLH